MTHCEVMKIEYFCFLIFSVVRLAYYNVEYFFNNSELSNGFNFKVVFPFVE